MSKSSVSRTHEVLLHSVSWSEITDKTSSQECIDKDPDETEQGEVPSISEGED